MAVRRVRLLSLLLVLVATFVTIAGSAIAAAGPNLDDYWNEQANFQFLRMWRSRSDDNPAYGFVLYNQQAFIVPVGNVWYSFSREAIWPLSKDIDAKRPSYCKYDYARFVLHSSTDNGATWNGRIVLVEPTRGMPWECAAVDGTAFYDASTTTWHLLFQCLSRSGPWAICHATRHSADPAGPFKIDPEPTVPAGGLVAKMGLMPPYRDEGTPQIVAKIGDRFYMTFHAYDGIHGVRAIAWTRDFRRWSFPQRRLLFGPQSCAGWNVPWSGPCIGGGWADMLQSGARTYMLIEAADKNLGGTCVVGKHWVFGLLRATNFLAEARAWEPLPRGPGIIFSLPSLSADQRACSDSYAQIFRSNGDTYLSVFQMPNARFPEGPATGRYLYVLRRGAPVASYAFRWGAADQHYALSDVISRGDLAAYVENARWLNPGLEMNGVDSKVVLPDTPILKRAAPWSLVVNLTLNAAPSRSVRSAFVAGDLSSAWLELYPDRTLCAWARTAGGPQNACAQLDLNRPTRIAMVATAGSIALSVDGKPPVTRAAASAKLIIHLSVGSAGPDANGLYGSWNGVLRSVSVFDHPLPR